MGKPTWDHVVPIRWDKKGRAIVKAAGGGYWVELYGGRPVPKEDLDLRPNTVQDDNRHR